MSKNDFYKIKGRFIAGFVIGANNVIVPLYVNELSPTYLKGKFVKLF